MRGVRAQTSSQHCPSEAGPQTCSQRCPEEPGNKTVPSFLRLGSSVGKRYTCKSPYGLGSIYNSLASSCIFTTGTGSLVSKR